MHIALVMLGGFFGAIMRYTISQLVKKLTTHPFPFATLFVNGTGSFVLGWLLAIGASTSYQLFFGVGFCGAYTTFSTMNLEFMKLVKTKNLPEATGYLVGSYIIGLVLALAGFIFGSR